MGFFRSLFGSDIPVLNSYADVYELAFDYISKNKNKTDLVKVLKQAIDIKNPLGSDDISNVNSIAIWLTGNKEINSSKIIFNRILDYDPKNYQSLSMMLIIAMAENDQRQINLFSNKLLDADFRQYIEKLKPTLESNIPNIRNSIKNQADIYNNIGEMFINEKDYEKAKKSFEIAFEIDPTFFEAHHNISITLYYLRRYNEAISSLEKDINILNAKNQSLLHHEQVMKVYNEYLSRIYFNIAKSYYRINNLKETKIYLKKSLILNNEYDSNNIDAAIDEFIGIFRHDPML
jgi:tetratricopeptide (TPR) repeat protein